MEEKNLSGRESLDLIQQMIQVAKEEHRESGDGWLIWGWLLFGASIASVILAHLKMWRYISWVWLGALAVGFMIGFILYLAGRSHTQKVNQVKTYVQELLGKFGAGFFASLFILVAANFIYRENGGFLFGYYYVLYAFWMFIHGSAIRFRPLIMGAIVNWMAALAIFIIEDFRYDMIVSAVAILTGYLIPGYMLRAKYKKAQHS